MHATANARREVNPVTEITVSVIRPASRLAMAVACRAVQATQIDNVTSRRASSTAINGMTLMRGPSVADSKSAREDEGCSAVRGLQVHSLPGHRPVPPARADERTGPQGS